MAETNLHDLLMDSVKDYREGSIVKGTILEVRPREFLVDIGYKSEGVIPTSEFDEPDEIEVGDEIEVLLERLENDEGMIVLSKEKAARLGGSKRLDCREDLNRDYQLRLATNL